MFYDLIVFLPLLGFLIAGLFGQQIGARNSELVTTGLLGFCAFLSWIAFFTVGFGGQEHAEIVPVANWFISGKLSVPWSLRIDTLTAVMLVVVNTVSFLVHLYSIGYMAEDPSRPRFFAYLSLFTFAMLMLVTADNLVQMFFGWEGVGLAVLSADRVLVREALGQRGRDQGLRRQPRRRFRLRARHFPGLPADRLGELRTSLRRRARPRRPVLSPLGSRRRQADVCLLAAVHGRDGQVGAVLAAHLVARRDGGADAGLRADSRRDDGHRRRVHGGAAVAPVRPRSDRAQRRDDRRRHDGDVRRHGRPGAERHQEGHRLFDVLAARLHVRRSRRRRLWTRDFPSLHSRLLQGSAVPRRGLRHHRDASRAGHAGDGRLERRNPVHLLDDGGRHAGAHRRRHSVRPDRLRRRYFEGCDHRGGLRLARLRLGLRLPLRRRSRRADVVLLLAPDVHDLLRPSRRLVGHLARRRARPGRSRARQSRAWRPPPGARIAQRDADPARRARVRRDVCRHAVPALVHRQRLRGFLEGLAVRRADQQDPGTDGNGSLARFAVRRP